MAALPQELEVNEAMTFNKALLEIFVSQKPLKYHAVSTTKH